MQSVPRPTVECVDPPTVLKERPLLPDPVADTHPTVQPPGQLSFPGNLKFVLVLLLLGFVVQTGAMLLLRRHATVNLLELDEQEYWNIASKLLHGGLREFPVTRTLGFPLTIAAIRSVVGDSYFRVQFVLTSLLVFLAPLTYWLTRAVLGSERAVRRECPGRTVLAGLPASGGHTLQRQHHAGSLRVVFERLHLCVEIDCQRGVPVDALASLGCTSGDLHSFSANVSSLLTDRLCPAQFGTRRGFRRGLLSGCAADVGCLFVVLPWTAYMSLREGHFFLLCTNDGYDAQRRSEPDTGGDEGIHGSLHPRRPPVLVGTREAGYPRTMTGYTTPEERATLPAVELNRLLGGTHPGMGFIPSSRGRLPVRDEARLHVGYLSVLVEHVLVVVSAVQDTNRELSRSWHLLIASAVSLVRFRQHLRELSIFWTLPIFVTLIALISLGNWRYRMPGDLGLIVLTAALLAYPEVKRFLVSMPNDQRMRKTHRMKGRPVGPICQATVPPSYA